MKRQHILLSCLLLLLAPALWAKEGVGVYFKVSLQGKLYPSLHYLVEEDFRPDQEGNGIGYSLTSGELNWRLHRQLRLGAGYSYLSRPGNRTEQRHRYYLYANGQLPLGSFQLALRERFQSTYKIHQPTPTNFLRTMLTLSYRRGKSAFSPFSYVELFNGVGQHKKAHLDKIRLSGGCNYRLNPHNSFQLYYRYNIVYVKDPVNFRHCIGLTYTHTF